MPTETDDGSGVQGGLALPFYIRNRYLPAAGPGGIQPIDLVRFLGAAPGVPADAATLAAMLPVVSQMAAYNGSTREFWRNNVEGTALASAARTATTSSADIINYNHRGIAVFLNITAASGTGGLQVVVQYKDPISGSYSRINALPTAVTAAGLTTYNIYPGIANVGAQGTSAMLPRTFRIQVVHGDATSYTYSVGYSLIN